MMVFVGIVILVTLVGLIFDWMRPGLLLLTSAIVLMVGGAISPQDVLNGFSNKGLITVGMLYLISEGVRRSGALTIFTKKFFPKNPKSVRQASWCIYPLVTFVSTFLNNTPVVVIFAPIVKRWAKHHHLSPTKFLIPLSYAVALGGLCTLIGSSTNLVFDGLLQDSGFKGMSMFEIGKVGFFIALAGLLYLILFSGNLLPDKREDLDESDDSEHEKKNTETHCRVEAVLNHRFPGLEQTLKSFNFERHYNAHVVGLRRNEKEWIGRELERIPLKAGDVLILEAENGFIEDWGESSVFTMLIETKEDEDRVRKQRRLGIYLLLFLISGAVFSELPVSKELFPNVPMDMFFFVSITLVLMAWLRVFPIRKYTKYISWDVLITIAAAFALSKGIENCGLAQAAGDRISSWSGVIGPMGCLILVYLVANVVTELITNNAAVAITFPLALSIAKSLHVHPMPFLMTICIASSASFLTPIGYQTNMIVQGVGRYHFSDFLRVGWPLTIIVMVVTIFLVPRIWAF